MPARSPAPPRQPGPHCPTTCFRMPGPITPPRFAAGVPLSEVSSLAGLVELIVRLGRQRVDPAIAPETIKLHYLLPDGGKPKKVAVHTPWDEARRAVAFVVTPA